ncbi:MAG: hypothetical protein IPN94_03710 [Sphingobacteriales bacterium]|nr:hypothetical protein [Sphingobacteriales bacterium]
MLDNAPFVCATQALKVLVRYAYPYFLLMVGAAKDSCYCPYPDCYFGVNIFYYALILSNGIAPNEFIINGFGGFDSPPVNVSAYITGKDTFIVPFQSQPDWGLSVEGQENTTGTLNRNEHTITLPYKIIYADAENTVDTCTITLTRQ